MRDREDSVRKAEGESSKGRCDQECQFQRDLSKTRSEKPSLELTGKGHRGGLQEKFQQNDGGSQNAMEIRSGSDKEKTAGEECSCIRCYLNTYKNQ